MFHCSGIASYIGNSLAAYLRRSRTGAGYGAPLRSLHDLQRLCRGLVGKKICFKLVEGYGGAGFFAFEVAEQDGEPVLRHPFSGAQTSLSEWWTVAGKNCDGYIVEHYLRSIRCCRRSS